MQLTSVHRTPTMATATLVVPHFIQEDVFTQNLVDDLHRLERQWAQAQDAYQRHASDHIIAMLQYYGVELEELGFIIRDRLLALTLEHGDEVDDARVQRFFGALTSQAQTQAMTLTEHADELDEATIAALAALEFESDDEQEAPTNDHGRTNPWTGAIFRINPVAPMGPQVVPPLDTIDRAPTAFPVVIPDFLPG
jgi:hypothetical protein